MFPQCIKRYLTEVKIFLKLKGVSVDNLNFKEAIDQLEGKRICPRK